MKPVLALAALLVAAVIGLVVWMSRNSEPSAPVAATRSERSEPSESAQARPPRRNLEGRERDRLAAASESTGSAGSADQAVREYAVGDVIVHDRRKNPGPPLTEPPSFVPPEGYRLTPEYATRVTTDLEPAVKKCMQALPAGSIGASTKLNVTMTVAVKNGSLTVSDVAAKAPELDESVLAQTLGCMRQQMIGSTLDAAGQPDVPAYSISTYYTP